jgi:hypothetical protein
MQHIMQVILDSILFLRTTTSIKFVLMRRVNWSIKCIWNSTVWLISCYINTEQWTELTTVIIHHQCDHHLGFAETQHNQLMQHWFPTSNPIYPKQPVNALEWWRSRSDNWQMALSYQGMVIASSGVPSTYNWLWQSWVGPPPDMVYHVYYIILLEYKPEFRISYLCYLVSPYFMMLSIPQTTVSNNVMINK